MKIKMSRPAWALFTRGLLALIASGQPNPHSANGEARKNNESVQALKLRIQTLEAAIAARQRRIDDLELSPSSSMPIVPLSFPETQMPLGARPFQLNGMEFREIPVASTPLSVRQAVS